MRFACLAILCSLPFFGLVKADKCSSQKSCKGCYTETECHYCDRAAMKGFGNLGRCVSTSTECSSDKVEVKASDLGCRDDTPLSCKECLALSDTIFCQTDEMSRLSCIPRLVGAFCKGTLIKTKDDCPSESKSGAAGGLFNHFCFFSLTSTVVMFLLG